MTLFDPRPYWSAELWTASPIGTGFTLCAGPVLQDGMAFRRAAALQPGPACTSGLVVA
jgi:hypothetical protein